MRQYTRTCLACGNTFKIACFEPDSKRYGKREWCDVKCRRVVLEKRGLSQPTTPLSSECCRNPDIRVVLGVNKCWTCGEPAESEELAAMRLRMFYQGRSE